MIKILEKVDCCGCAACSNICPKCCITMTSDEEGFLYPSVDEALCIDCGLCEKVCPELNPVEEKVSKQIAFLVQHKNEQIRKESTSGGAFTAIAEYVLNNGGVVFGVAYDNTFKVIHKYVESVDDLRLFRNSKYVQSEIGNTFKQAKEFLIQDRLVCFSGTPCQIEGLKNYLRKDFDNLITIDFVCRAVPSPLLLEKYLKMQKRTLNVEFTNVAFRDKYYGYKYSNLSIYTKNNNVSYHRGVETDPYLRSFFSNICDRPSCYDCSFKKRYRNSDLTLWDCFAVDVFDKKMDDDKGTTRILTHTEKANAILANISEKVLIKEIDVEDAVRGVREMVESVPVNARRKQFFEDLNEMKPEVLFSKYFPNNVRARGERLARLVSYKLGVYQNMKKIIKLVYKNKNNQKQ